jgi:aminoglycoside 6'-N-acetyltransferase
MDIVFRRLERSDLALVGTWLSQPHVARWWREGHDPEALEARYGPCIDGTDPTEVRVTECDGEPIGLVQRYDVADHPDWARTIASTGLGERAAGMDYLIGDEARTGHGLGPLILARFVEETWARYPEATAVAVAMQQANRASWRAVEKCGFERFYAGELDSDDPSDQGPSYLYVLRRPDPARPA